MENHRIFYCQTAALRDDPLIIRFAVLACVENCPILHRLLCLRDVPARRIGSRKPDIRERSQHPEHIHGRGRYQINLFDRALKHLDRIRKIFRHLSALWNQKKTASIRNRNCFVLHPFRILIGIDRKLGRIGKLHPRFPGQGRTDRLTRLWK